MQTALRGVQNTSQDGARPHYGFTAKGFAIFVWFLDGKVSHIVYQKLDSEIDITAAEIEILLQANVPNGVSWSAATKDDEGLIWYNGWQDNNLAFMAGYRPKNNSLSIWTKADSDFAEQEHKENAKGL
jgi:hypothetical protein